MREKIAVAVSVLTAAVLVTLSAVFAGSQNPTTVSGGPEESTLPAPPPPSGEAGVAGAPESGGTDPAKPGAGLPPFGAAQSAPADSARGRAVFAANGCLRCHSVGGEGNPRNPLDGVGARRTPGQLRAWTVGAEVVADSLPPSALRAKQAFQQIPEAELLQLLVYLSSLRQPLAPE